MNDSALKEALQRLLAHGDAAQDAKMMKMAKKGPAPEMCPECKKPMAEGKCPSCGYEEGAGEDDGDLASLLEQGAKGE